MIVFRMKGAGKQDWGGNRPLSARAVSVSCRGCLYRHLNEDFGMAFGNFQELLRGA